MVIEVKVEIGVGLKVKVPCTLGAENRVTVLPYMLRWIQIFLLLVLVEPEDDPQSIVIERYKSKHGVPDKNTTSQHNLKRYK